VSRWYTENLVFCRDNADKLFRFFCRYKDAPQFQNVPIAVEGLSLQLSPGIDGRYTLFNCNEHGSNRLGWFEVDNSGNLFFEISGDLTFIEVYLFNGVPQPDQIIGLTAEQLWHLGAQYIWVKDGRVVCSCSLLPIPHGVGNLSDVGPWLVRDDSGLRWGVNGHTANNRAYQCPSAPGPQETERNTVRWQNYRTEQALTPKSNPTKSRIVGVEIEVNGKSPFNKVVNAIEAAHCMVKADVSCGWEVVTPPTRANDLSKLLTPLVSCLVENKETADSRCGLHVHVDARDLDYKDIGKLLTIWDKVEPIMFLLAGQERYFSKYSKPMADFCCDKKCLAGNKDAIDEKVSHTPGGIARYRAINLVNFRDKVANKCTIEFRLHEGTLDINRIVGWAKVLAALTSKAKNSDAAALKAVTQTRSPLRALCEFLPKHQDWIIERVQAYRKETCIGKKVRKVKFEAQTSVVNRSNRGGVSIHKYYLLLEELRRQILNGGLNGEYCDCTNCLNMVGREEARRRGIAIPEIINEDLVTTIRAGRPLAA